MLGLDAEANWFPTGAAGSSQDQMHANASSYTSPNGTFTVATHSIVGTNLILGPDGSYINGQQAWNLIKQKYKNGHYKKVRLGICQTTVPGQNGHSFAQDFYNASGGTPEEATSHGVIYRPDGSVQFGNPVPGMVGLAYPLAGGQWEQIH
jgi:hypothetical protein